MVRTPSAMPMTFSVLLDFIDKYIRQTSDRQLRHHKDIFRKHKQQVFMKQHIPGYTRACLTQAEGRGHGSESNRSAYPRTNVNGMIITLPAM